MKYFLDPTTEVKVANEKVKEKERHIEALKAECTRWQEEANELNIKCQSYEAQLEQRLADYRQTLSQKDVIFI